MNIYYYSTPNNPSSWVQRLWVDEYAGYLLEMTGDPPRLAARPVTRLELYKQPTVNLTKEIQKIIGGNHG